MESNPADNAETDYAAGAIQFTWTEGDELRGRQLRYGHAELGHA